MGEVSGAKTFTATMVAEASQPDEQYFLDTSVIVAATVAVHPSYVVAGEFVDEAVGRGAGLNISPQVCREYLVVLTRQPVSGRVFTVDEAVSALRVWQIGCRMLSDDEAVSSECIGLVQRFGVQGKQVHDCNIVATMKAHGLRKLATRNARDFRRYEGEIEVIAIE